MKREQFDHLCWLARLELGPQELTEFTAKFERLLGFVTEIQNYQTAGDETPLVLGGDLEFRSDTKRDFEWPAGFEHNYHVPQIIDFNGGE